MKRSVSAMCVLCIMIPAAFAQQGNKDEEIKRLRKELSQLQTERQKNMLDIKKDRADFSEYTKRTAERLAALKNETNSINQQIAAQKRKNDSLAALVNYANSQTRQAEMSQNAMREKMAGTCDHVINNMKKMPPMVRQNLVASVSLLKNELRNKSIDNVEALSRMQQILSRADETMGSIQVSQESSPIPEVRGTVYRLRIGAFFEAVVDVKGENAAVWYGTDTLGWRMVKDAATASDILKAANIREGKALPAFAHLPLVAVTGKGDN